MNLLNEGVDVDLHKSSIDAAFERICSALLNPQRGDKIWYDGTANLVVEKNSNQILDFKGNMNIMEGQKKHWMEPFRAEVVTDAQAKAKCSVSLSCGEYQSSGNLYDLYEYS